MAELRARRAPAAARLPRDPRARGRDPGRITRDEGRAAPRYLAKAVYLPENAIDPERFKRPSAAPPAPPLRIAFVGRLVPYKGADMLLEAVAPLARCRLASVDVIGDGPELPLLHALVERERISAAVRFAGWVEHRALQEHLAGCHVFGFPSVREFGGGAVAEAMAVGLVPIVTDFGGPGELASRGTGFIVPLGERHEIVAALRRVLEQLVANPRPLPAMAARARRRVFELFTWPAKAAQTREVYEWVLGRREKPDFGMPLADRA